MTLYLTSIVAQIFPNRRKLCSFSPYFQSGGSTGSRRSREQPHTASSSTQEGPSYIYLTSSTICWLLLLFLPFYSLLHFCFYFVSERGLHLTSRWVHLKANSKSSSGAFFFTGNQIKPKLYIFIN